MQGKDAIVVVTGAASGIGRALALRFRAEGARQVVAVDINEAGARDTAAAVDGVAMTADVGREADVAHFLDSLAEPSYRGVDLLLIDQNPKSRIRDLISEIRISIRIRIRIPRSRSAR